MPSIDTAFALYDDSSSRILDVQHVLTEADAFDEIRVTVAKVAASLEAGKTYDEGATGIGNFKCTGYTSRWGTGGEVIQDAIFKGVFANKKREETDFNLETYSLTNFKLNVSGFTFPSGTGTSTVWDRGNITVALPVFIVEAVDTTAPALNLVGKEAAAPYGGGSFPTAPANPFTVSADNATIQYPDGWVLMGIPSQENHAGGGVWKKRYIYHFRWNYIP